MALLNPPQILPNEAFIAYRAMLRLQGVQLENLVNLLRHPENEESQVIEITVRGGREVGLFEIDSDGEVTLGSTLANHQPQQDVRVERDSFRRAVVSLVLSAAANDHPPDSEGGATDFVRGLCWYLLQNPSDAPSRFQDSGGKKGAASVKAGQLGQNDDAVLRNDTRWGSFARWSTYLGFCRIQDSGIAPEPTPVIRDAILNRTLDRGVMPIARAVERLATALPVIDGGKYWIAMTNLVTGDVVPRDGEISATLSQSLLRMHEMGLVNLTLRSDADFVRFRLEDDRTTRYSHLEVKT